MCMQSKFNYTGYLKAWNFVIGLGLGTSIVSNGIRVTVAFNLRPLDIFLLDEEKGPGYRTSSSWRVRVTCKYKRSNVQASSCSENKYYTMISCNRSLKLTL